MLYKPEYVTARYLDICVHIDASLLLRLFWFSLNQIDAIQCPHIYAWTGSNMRTPCDSMWGGSIAVKLANVTKCYRLRLSLDGNICGYKGI